MNSAVAVRRQLPPLGVGQSYRARLQLQWGSYKWARADWPANDRWLDRIAALPGWAHPYDMMPGNPSDRT